MDQAEVVVSNISTVLSDADIEFGKKLWNELRANSQFPVKGMLWLLEGEWRLVIASDIVGELGPRDAYRKLAQVVQLAAEHSPQLSRLELVSPKNPLYEAFRTLWAQTPADRVEGARLTSSQVAGMYIDDAYFYGVR
jgi:hypothetical protein